jgi:ureidoglycolate amidohydrolase
MKARCEKAGLTVREDAIGNTFARWNGSDPVAPVVGTGSHIDAIPNAGKYDGVVGVLGGLEAIRALQRADFVRAFDRVADFHFAKSPRVLESGVSAAGFLSGTLSPDAARKLPTMMARRSTRFARSRIAGELEEVKLPSGYYKAFVELHIEQGPLLERERIPLGIVTKIAAPRVCAF